MTYEESLEQARQSLDTFKATNSGVHRYESSKLLKQAQVEALRRMGDITVRHWIDVLEREPDDSVVFEANEAIAGVRRAMEHYDGRNNAC